MSKETQEPEPNQVDPALITTWERLLKLARGSAEVMEVLLPVAAGLTRDELARLLARAGGWRDGSRVDALEQVWKLLGVVPHDRYRQLLDRYETLRGRVEEAESGLRELRARLAEQEREARARESLETWGSLVRRTLSAQAELVRQLAGPEGGGPEPEPEPEVKPASASDRPARRRSAKPGSRPPSG